MKNVAIIVASDGHNLKLAQTLGDIFKKKNIVFNIVEITSLDLPLFSSKAQKEGIPVCIETQKKNLENTTHLIFITPEYNGGLPPALTNYIAWMSVSGKEWRESFNGKRAIIGTHSAAGGLHALMALRTQLSYIGVDVMGRQIHTHFKKELNLEVAEELIGCFLN